MQPPLCLTAPESRLSSCWLPAGIHPVAPGGDGPPPRRHHSPVQGKGANRPHRTTHRSAVGAIGRDGHHNTPTSRGHSLKTRRWPLYSGARPFPRPHLRAGHTPGQDPAAAYRPDGDPAATTIGWG
ncbi:hypothetical protein NDU88_000367 [Pleurodeles waltl]|uniref:Uncharacterized protein n=1 Tax=Pleurodeles waltl TaxID=8319 RepID=A0AAV7S6V1_PLEWA|nr:hypothetical protein NDU88_000367 [Pleurodeles waltl]